MAIPPRARWAFLGTGLGLVSLVVTWFGAHEVAALRQVDVEILQGFLQLGRPVLDAPAQLLTSLFDPFPYVLLAAVPVVLAWRRGRRDVAVTIAVLLIGANVSAELLKPLAAGPRDWVPVPGVALGDASWPSGHSTASMSLALALIISVPGRWRPITASVMAALVVAVVYSLLALGWHYPSDVLGGFELASTWTLLTLGGLWTYEAHRPALTARLSDAALPSARFSVGEALRPTFTLLLAAAGLGGIALVARPHLVDYATAHPAFVTGACALAVLSFACATGLSLLLGRPPTPSPGSGRAPTGVHRPRPGRSLLG